MKAIGIDIGTTTISAVVMDARSDRVQTARTIANPGFLPQIHPWERQQDPDAIVTAARQLLDELLDSNSDTAAIGLTGQMHGIVYADDAGAAVSPLITWQDERGNQPVFDGRSACEAIAERFGVKAYSGYGLISHLCNLRMGQVPARAAKLAAIPDYFGMALTSASSPTLHSSNAASLGLYDLRTNRFRQDILAAFGEDGGILPEVTDRFEPIGTYRGIPVCVSIGDNQASFLGAVRHADEEILANMGTGGQISLLSDAILDAPEIETRPFNEGRYLVVGSLLCGGRAYATLAGFFKACAAALGGDGSDVYGAMARLLPQAEGLEPLKVDTRFAGTREHPETRGSIGNIGYANFTPAALVRGVLEGMAQELLGHYRTMQRGLGLSRSRIIASGNGMRRNAALRRITGEMFGMELTLSQQDEEAACGAAIAGLSAVGQRAWQDAVGLGGHA